MNLKAIREKALEEFREEQFRKAVDEQLARLRAHRPWWHRVFPFTVKIERRK